MRRLDVFKAIHTRRSIRRFTDRPIEPQLLEQILEAARWTPSDENRQRCRFVVVQSPSLVLLVKRFSPGINSVPQCIIAICRQCGSKPSRFGDYLAIVGCGMAAQNILLAAQALGLGACVVRSFSSAGVREIISLPNDVELELLVTLGYPGEMPEPPVRKPLTEIAFRDRYGKSW